MKITAGRLVFSSMDFSPEILDNEKEVISSFAKVIGAEEYKKFPLLPDNHATYFSYDGANKWGFPESEINGYAQIAFMAWATKTPFQVFGSESYVLIQSLVALAGGPSMSPGSNQGALVAENSLKNLSVIFDGKVLKISAGEFVGRVIGRGGKRVKVLKEIFGQVIVR